MEARKITAQNDGSERAGCRTDLNSFPNIIAMHTGSAGAFDPARMMFPPEEKEASSQEMQNLYMTNVYRIQNLTEENYLYRQNFQFLTQMFEKQIHKKLYPQVERQVEKTIRQKLPDLHTTLNI